MKTIKRSKDASIRWIIRQLLRGVWVRIIAAFRRPSFNTGSVREFFKKARRLERRHEVIDLSDPSYSILCEGFEEIAGLTRAEELRVMDLGCGSCTFYKYLKSRDFIVRTYMGVDLFFGQEDISYCKTEGITLVESDISEETWTVNGHANLLVAINCFCYLFRLKKLVKRLEGVELERVSHFAVIEPIPSLLWETSFEGILLCLRAPKEIDLILERAGWKLQGRHILYAAAFLGKFLFPMSHLSVYRKEKQNRTLKT